MSEQQVRVSRPVASSDNGNSGSSGSGNWLPWVIAAVVVVVLVGGVAIFRESIFKGGKMGGDKMMTSKGGESVPAGYQAVFLTNGQVYFGKLSNMHSQFPVLKEIYYLQVTQPPLQGSQQQGQQAQSQAQPQISLVKLGQELHGPVDEMAINRDQILFWENMKDDSQVVTAIKDYIANPQGNQAPAPQTAPAGN